MGTNSEFCSDERVGYTLLKSFLAGDVNANRCYAGLSPEEQQRLVSGAKSLRTPTRSPATSGTILTDKDGKPPWSA